MALRKFNLTQLGGGLCKCPERWGLDDHLCFGDLVLSDSFPLPPRRCGTHTEPLVSSTPSLLPFLSSSLSRLHSGVLGALTQHMCLNSVDGEMYQGPTAAVTNDHQPSGLKRQNFILSQFWKPGVQNQYRHIPPISTSLVTPRLPRVGNRPLLHV